MTAVDFFLLDLKVRSTIFLAALVVFALGVLVGRLARALPEPPLKEAPRPAEACVEEWTAEDVARFPEARARAYAETDWIGADDP